MNSARSRKCAVGEYGAVCGCGTEIPGWGYDIIHDGRPWCLMCDGCGIRGPWAATAAEAREAWDLAVAGRTSDRATPRAAPQSDEDRLRGELRRVTAERDDALAEVQRLRAGLVELSGSGGPPPPADTDKEAPDA